MTGAEVAESHAGRDSPPERTWLAWWRSGIAGTYAELPLAWTTVLSAAGGAAALATLVVVLLA